MRVGRAALFNQLSQAGQPLLPPLSELATATVQVDGQQNLVDLVAPLAKLVGHDMDRCGRSVGARLICKVTGSGGTRTPLVADVDEDADQRVRKDAFVELIRLSGCTRPGIRRLGSFLAHLAQASGESGIFQQASGAGCKVTCLVDNEDVLLIRRCTPEACQKGRCNHSRGCWLRPVTRPSYPKVCHFGGLRKIHLEAP